MLTAGVAGLAVMLAQAGPTGASVANRGVVGSAAASGQVVAGDSVSAANVALVLAGPRSSSGFERALGLSGPGWDLSAPAPRRASTAHSPVRRPSPVARAIAAMTTGADRIATLPYVYGGGHGSFDASGYDCSGSISYVLHAAGLLSIPADSSGLESFGEPGPGRHVTIYANAQHALMTIDGRRFDTIALQETGTRWASSLGATDGYVQRHPPGL